MKKLLAVVLLAALAFAGAAGAEEKLKIGYVDVRQVLIESNTGKQFQASTEKTGKEKQNMFAAEEKKLQALKDAYEKSTSGVKKSAFADSTIVKSLSQPAKAGFSTPDVGF